MPALYDGRVRIGGPLRGLRRAWRISVGYAVSYFLWGTLWAIVLGVPLDVYSRGHNLPDFFTANFGLSVALVLPSAFVTNLFLVRIFGRKTWRGDVRRYRVSGLIGIFLTWGGAILFVYGGGMWIFAGGNFGMMELTLSVMALLSNASLVAGWLLPAKREKSGPNGPPWLPSSRAP